MLSIAGIVVATTIGLLLPASAAAARTAAPRLAAAATRDADGDGRIDELRLRFQAPVRVGTLRQRRVLNIRGFVIHGIPDRGRRGRPTRFVRVLLREHKASDTGARPTVTYRDRGVRSRLRATDDAPPLLLGARPLRGRSAIVTTWSERVRERGRRRPFALGIAGGRTVSGLVVGIGRNRRTLTLALSTPGTSLRLGDIAHAMRRFVRDRSGNRVGSRRGLVHVPGRVLGTGGGALDRAVDPRQLSALEFGERSHWLQPWRAYLDTWPSTRLHEGIGMVAHAVSAAEIDTYAGLLAQAGVRHVRLELPWSALSYADETRLTNEAEQRAILRSLKAHGLRPLILLNWHHGRPCPLRQFSAYVAGAAGQRTVTFRPPAGEPVVPGYTGISESQSPQGSVGAYYLIESYDAASGQATLSQPLRRSYGGQTEAMTLKYRPFDLPGTPGFEQTLAGLLRYVDAVVALASSELGPGGFDLEFYNEMTFGYAFWSIAYYRGDQGGQDWYWRQGREALRRFVAHVRSRYGGAIGLSDGLASQLPWPGGGSGPASEPAGLSALSKHYYAGAGQAPKAGGGTAVDALGNVTAFEPSYRWNFPEYWLSGLQTETLIRDISPFLAVVGQETHGRPTGLAVWETEFNLETTDWQRKAIVALRAYVSHLHKGVGRLYFHAAKEDGLSLRMVDPAQPGGGPVLAALRRLLAAVPAWQGTVHPLGLASVADAHDHAQFAGDGSLLHPPLYDRELIGFHPFQTGASAWAIPVYVQTRDVLAPYGTREFTLAITGLQGAAASASLYDPLTDASVPVSVVSRAPERIVVSLPLSDYPRVLTLRDGS